MPDHEKKLGGRLPLLHRKELKGDQARLYELLDTTLVAWAGASGFKGKTGDEALIGPFNPNLYSPGITPAWVRLVQDESKNTSLGKRVHEVVILSVGAVWKSPYALYAHSAIARGAGLPDAAIQALVAGKQAIEHLLPAEQVAHRFARQLASVRQVDDGLYKEAENIFGRAGLVDMSYLIGIYLLTCAMLNAFEVPAPD